MTVIDLAGSRSEIQRVPFRGVLRVAVDAAQAQRWIVFARRTAGSPKLASAVRGGRRVCCPSSLRQPALASGQPGPATSVLGRTRRERPSQDDLFEGVTAIGGARRAVDPAMGRNPGKLERRRRKQCPRSRCMLAMGETRWAPYPARPCLRRSKSWSWSESCRGSVSMTCWPAHGPRSVETTARFQRRGKRQRGGVRQRPETAGRRRGADPVSASRARRRREESGRPRCTRPTAMVWLRRVPSVPARHGGERGNGHLKDCGRTTCGSRTRGSPRVGLPLARQGPRHDPAFDGVPRRASRPMWRWCRASRRDAFPIDAWLGPDRRRPDGRHLGEREGLP